MSYPISTSCGEVGLILHYVLDNVLPFKTNGTFIEVGANDGKTGSFTYNLAHLGWNGLNFEPIPRLFKKCQENHKEHKNVKNICCAIGETDSEAEIYDADTLSTLDIQTYQNYKEVPQFKNMCKNNEKILVKVRRLNDILVENKISNIDLMILDVEGYEEHVLKGFDIDSYMPFIFIIEIGDQHPDFIHKEDMMKRFSNLRRYFNEHNYTLLVNDIVDNVYIHNDVYKNLNKEFIQNIKKMVKFQQYSK